MDPPPKKLEKLSIDARLTDLEADFAALEDRIHKLEAQRNQSFTVEDIKITLRPSK